MTAFSKLIGQPQAVELLSNAVNRNRIAPAYLFSGPEGVGRYLAAIEFSVLLLAADHQTSQLRHKVETHNHPDLLKVEPTYLHQGNLLTEAEAEAEGLQRKAPPQIRVEQVRDISNFLSSPPLEAPRAVIIIEAAHTMAEAAGNALLKTLEEPGQAVIILIAPSPSALLPTLVSRCQRIPFYRLAEADLKQVLVQTDHSDIIQQETALAIAQGSPGQAITANQHLQTIPSHLLEQLEKMTNDQEQSLIKNVEIALNLAKEITNTLDFSEQIWLVNYLQQCYWQSHLHGKLGDILPKLKQLETARQQLINYVQPRLVWETTFLQNCQSLF